MYIDDDYLTMKRHILSIRRSFTSSPDGKIQYQIIHDNEELVNSLLDGNDDGYPLKKQVRRDRFVLNSDAMRTAMQKATEKALNQFEKEIVDYIQRDVSTLVEQTATDALNSIVFDGMSFSPSKQQKQPQSFAYRLGAMFGKALGNAIWDAFEETIKSN